MSTGCQRNGPINMINYCDVPDGVANQVITNYCNYTYSGSIPQQTKACNTASTAGEWVPAGAGSVGCHFDPQNPGQMVVPSSSCNSVEGSYGLCKRAFYSGDPLICCLKSMDCYTATGPMPDQCYSDPEKNNTCDPQYRQLTNTPCQDLLFSYCSGQTGTSTQWFDYWLRSENSCTEAIIRNVYRNINNGCPQNLPKPISYPCGVNQVGIYDAQGYYWAQSLMTEAFRYYNRLGYVVGSAPGDVGFSAWQEEVYNKICCAFPGLCQGGLAESCANQTVLNLSRSPRAVQFCGCHLPPAQYLEYSAKYNVSTPCTPVCNRFDAIPVTDINGRYLPCQQNVCILDDTTVNLINSTVGGGLDFTQVCGSCPTGACSCIASNNTIDVINSSIGGNFTPVLENCGSFSRQQTNPATNIGPVNIPVPRGVTGIFNPFSSYQEKFQNSQQQQKKVSWLWTMLIVVISLVIIFLLVWALSKRPVEEPVIPRPPLPRYQYPDTRYRDPPRTLHKQKANFFKADNKK